MTVDWDELKSLVDDRDFGLVLAEALPAILAAHERSERVIEAADKLREAIRGIKIDIDNAMPNTVFPYFEEALAEFDKAKQS